MKNILITLIVLIGTGLILYFNLNSDDEALSKPSETIISVVEKNNHIAENNSKPHKKEKIDEEIVEVKFSQYNKTVLSGFCGHSFTDNSSLNNSLNKESLSIAQLEALSKLNDECQLWYEHIDGMPDEELNEYKEKYKSKLESQINFIARDPGINDPVKISEARSQINLIDKTFNYMSLDYLLVKDNDLIKEIANYINTKDLNYIKSSHLNITLLFACDINPQSCHPDSLESMIACLDSQESCGYSLQQEIISSVSPNQYLDLMNMVSYIKILINQGYFE